MNQSRRLEVERTVALWLWLAVGDRTSEVREWVRLTGKSQATYYRRLRQARERDAELVAAYPELQDAYALYRDRQRKDEQDRRDGMEERRRAAWEQVRRLCGQG